MSMIMLRSGDIALFNKDHIVRKCDRITENTKIPANAFFLNKTTIIDSGVTLSFLGDIQLRKDTKFIFSDEGSPGKVIFYGQVFGEYNVLGNGTVVKFPLEPIVMPKENVMLIPDDLVMPENLPVVHDDDVTMIGEA